MRYNTIPCELFRKNRAKIFDNMQEESFAILYSAEEKLRNGDNLYPFRQDSDFFYLTGIEQAKSILLLIKKNSRAILFLEEPNAHTETWTGKKLSRKKACQISGIEEIYWLPELDSILEKILVSTKNIYLKNDEEISAALQFKQSTENTFNGRNFHDLSPIFTHARLVKEPEEIDLIKTACRITTETFFDTLKHIKPNAKEYQIEAALTYGFLSRGASGHAFPPIIASGKNALVLHYIENDSTLNNEELLLLDFGCEYANYSSDCSRTIPVNGHFTSRQKECYEAVCRVFERAKNLFMEGNCIENINKEVACLLEKEMIALDLFSQRDVDKQDPQNPLYKKYYMHGATHFIGLDTHDVGSKQTPLKENMILSCEPGIYIKEENIGIRIETMMLVTKSKPIDLLSNIPSEISEIEKLMRLR